MMLQVHGLLPADAQKKNTRKDCNRRDNNNNNNNNNNNFFNNNDNNTLFIDFLKKIDYLQIQEYEY